MEFREITITRKRVSLDDIEEGTRVYADIGRHITDAQVATVVDINPSQNRVVVSLGEDRMDGPYLIPVTNIRRVVDTND